MQYLTLLTVLATAIAGTQAQECVKTGWALEW